jgi:spore germination cell wall hydrolase CwlJ-like protein
MREDEAVSPLNPFVSLLEVSASASATAENVRELQENVRRQLAMAEGTVQLIHSRAEDAKPALPNLDAARDALNIIPTFSLAVPPDSGWWRRASGLIGVGSLLTAAGAGAAFLWINTSEPARALAPSPAAEAKVIEAVQPQVLREPQPQLAATHAEPLDDLGRTIYAAQFASAPAHERKCLARALYYEARGESYEGQVAVAQVIMNRVRMTGWPDSICGVVNQGIDRGEKCQFSFACHVSAIEPAGELWDSAKDLAADAIAGRAWLREAMDATHYHTVNVAPVWRLGLTPIRTIGKHTFYREQDGLAKAGKVYSPHATPTVVVVPVKRPRPATARPSEQQVEAKAASKPDDNWGSLLTQR